MGKTAVIVIDMINTYDHPDADRLVPSVEKAIPALSGLLECARAAETPVIYVNDNFGEWRSHHGELVDKALASTTPTSSNHFGPTTHPSSWSRPGTPSSTRHH